MSTLTRGPAKYAEVERAMRRLRLTPAVARWEYKIADDWAGDPSLFILVVLTDEAAKPENIHREAMAVEKLIEKIDSYRRFDLFPYTTYRSQSEDAHDPNAGYLYLVALAEDLLEQARHLANRERRRPKQASLRRSLSTTYYSLFHLFVQSAITNWRGEAQRIDLARGFEHRTMRRASKRFYGMPSLGSNGP